MAAVDDDAPDTGAGERDTPPPHLLIVRQSRGGATRKLCEAAERGARHAVGGRVVRRVLGAFDAGPDDVSWADGVLLATPANFGYMSGAMKDFFERVYHQCLESSAGLPYALIVKGDTDVDGAVASVERITTGMRWRRVLPPVRVVGDPGAEDAAAAEELGATLAAGMAEGIF